MALSEAEELELLELEEQEALSKKKEKPLSFMEIAKRADATQLIKQAAPSNILEKIGVASANAPGITGMLLGGLPGGDASQIMPSLKNIQTFPGQGKRAIEGVLNQEAGGQLTEEERGPALAGRIAGTGLEMMAPSLGAKGIKGKNPFSAGVKDPRTALPGNFEKVGEELGVLKRAARVGENAGEARKLRMLLRKPNGVIELAEEAKAALETGKDVPVTKLLAYRQALGEAQAAGGTFADDYKQAADLGKELLKQKAPELSSKLEEMALNYSAVGKKTSFPWFTTALDPRVGMAKAATLPVVQNIAGAVLGAPIARFPGAVMKALSSIAKTLTEDKARDLLREARNDKAKARELAKSRGFAIPE